MKVSNSVFHVTSNLRVPCFFFLRNLALSLSICGLIACGDGNGGDNGGGRGGPGSGPEKPDSTSPTVISVPTERLIDQTRTISIVFNESMDTAIGHWQLGGSLASESNGGRWTSTTQQNDTLYIDPSFQWTANTQRTLIVDAKDLAGNPVDSIHLEYDVYRGILYYVDASMPDDSGDGRTPATAKKFIHTAVANAALSATVVVNAGTYIQNSDQGTQIALRRDISLYGGYNADFSVRDPTTYISLIEDQSIGSNCRALEAGGIQPNGQASSISPSTILDGFTIKGSTQPGALSTEAVWLGSPLDPTWQTAPTLQNNVIYGGSGENSSSGIRLASGASPLIQNNQINGGGSMSSTDGIFNAGLSPTIRNNIIFAGNSQITGIVGTGSSRSSGIVNLSIDAEALSIIQNNIIHGGSSDNAFGIYNISNPVVMQNNTIYSGGNSVHAYGIADYDPGTNTMIDNNIIFSNGDAGSYCLYKVSTTSNPASIRNNNLFNCPVIYASLSSDCPGNDDGDNNPLTCSLAELNTLIGVLPYGAIGNVSVDMSNLFADMAGTDNDLNTPEDNDWRLSSATPDSVAAGGLNGRDQVPAWTFTTDLNDFNRPDSGTPWSIGAYEP